MLTVAELRRHIETALDDDAVQRLLDAAAEDIAHDATTSELVTPVGDLLPLSYTVASLTEVIEDDDTLATDDYELIGNQLVRRLNSGTNPRRSWRSPVRATYSRMTNEATKEIVQVALVQMDINYQPGIQQNSAGSWNESFVGDYTTERRRILARLSGPASTVWPL
jgi:hypothetical protein